MCCPCAKFPLARSNVRFKVRRFKHDTQHFPLNTLHKTTPTTPLITQYSHVNILRNTYTQHAYAKRDTQRTRHATQERNTPLAMPHLMLACSSCDMHHRMSNTLYNCELRAPRVTCNHARTNHVQITQVGPVVVPTYFHSPHRAQARTLFRMRLLTLRRPTHFPCFCNGRQLN